MTLAGLLCSRSIEGGDGPGGLHWFTPSKLVDDWVGKKHGRALIENNCLQIILPAIVFLLVAWIHPLRTTGHARGLGFLPARNLLKPSTGQVLNTI